MAEDSVLFLLLGIDFVVIDLEAVWSGPAAAFQRQRKMNVLRTALRKVVRHMAARQMT